MNSILFLSLLLSISFANFSSSTTVSATVSTTATLAAIREVSFFGLGALLGVVCRTAAPKSLGLTAVLFVAGSGLLRVLLNKTNKEIAEMAKKRAEKSQSTELKYSIAGGTKKQASC